MSAYREALKRGRKTGVSKAGTAESIAMFCESNVQILVGAVSPELVWTGAMAKRLTFLEFGRMCGSDPGAVEDLQWLDTVTVTPYGAARYHLEFSRLPDKVFGPYDLGQARAQLEIAALMTSTESRDAVFDARIEGVAVREMPHQ
jgi:hypothetical protein